jgi:hypothetical protein
MTLPAVAVGAGRSPALLSVVLTMSKHTPLVPLLAKDPRILRGVMGCLSVGARRAAARAAARAVKEAKAAKTASLRGVGAVGGAGGGAGGQGGTGGTRGTGGTGGTGGMGAAKEQWTPSGDVLWIVSKDDRHKGRGVGGDAKASVVGSRAAAVAGASDVSSGVLNAVLSVIEGVLDFDDLCETSQPTLHIGGHVVQSSRSSVLGPHIPDLLEHLLVRLGGGTAGESAKQGKGNKIKRSSTGVTSMLGAKELSILSRLASTLVTRPIEEDYAGAPRGGAIGGDTDDTSSGGSRGGAGERHQDTCSKLLSLLLPYLRQSRRLDLASMTDVIKTSTSLLPAVADVSSHVVFVSRLLAPGPNGSADIWGKPGEPTTPASYPVRELLAGLMQAFGEHPSTPWMAVPAELVADMNAMDPMKIDEYDFDRRLGAHRRLIEEGVFKELGSKGDRPQMVAIVCQLMHDMHDSEMAIRSSVQGVLAAVVKHMSAAVLAALGIDARNAASDDEAFSVVAVSSASADEDEEDEEDEEGVPQDMDVEGGRGAGAAAASSVAAIGLGGDMSLYEGIIMPMVRSGLKSRNDIVRSGFLQLLSDIVRGTQAAESPILHGDLAALLDDAEKDNDFFYCVTHVQLHRRVRAWAKFRARLGTGRVTLRQSTLVNVIMPLLTHPLHELIKVSEQSLLTEAILVMGEVSKQLTWSHYSTFLRQRLKAVGNAKPAQEGFMVRAMCAILDGFHFRVGNDEAEAERDAEMVVAATAAKEAEAAAREAREAKEGRTGGETKGEEGEGETKGDVADGGDEEGEDNEDGEQGEDGEEEEDDNEQQQQQKDADDEKARRQNLRVLRVMHEQLLPEVRSYLVSKTENGNNKLRTVVALALVKVLGLLPPVVMRRHLPGTLNHVCSQLRSKLQVVRDDTRSVLVKISKTLGPHYFPFVIRQLCDSLREGYQISVLSFTVHSLLFHMCGDPRAQKQQQSAASKEGEKEGKEEGGDGGEGGDEEKEGDRKQSKKQKTSNKKHLKDSGDVDDEEEPVVAGEHRDEHNRLMAGSLEECMETLMEVFMDDVFGNTGQRRSNDGWNPRNKTKEGASLKSLDSFELMASAIHFLPGPAIHGLVGPVLSLLQSSRKVGSLKQAQEVLRRVASGLSKNGSVTVEHYLRYIYETLRVHSEVIGHTIDAANEEIEAKEAGKKGKKGKKGAKGAGKKKGGGNKFELDSWVVGDEATTSETRLALLQNAKRNYHKVDRETRMTGRFRHKDSKAKNLASQADNVMSEYALKLLRQALRRRGLVRSLDYHERTANATTGSAGGAGGAGGGGEGKQDGAESARQTPTALGMLDPFVGVIEAICGTSRDTGVLSLGYSCFCTIVEFPLPSLRRHVPRITKHIFAAMGRANGNTGSAVVQSCFTAVTAVLRKCSYHKPSDAQLRLVVDMARTDIEEVRHQNTTFALIKSIVFRRLVSSEVYDLMERIAELLVQSQRAPVRLLCSQILLQFLLEYPLGDKRMAQHLDILVQNLGYVHESGRLAVVDTLQHILMRFPEHIIDKQVSGRRESEGKRGQRGREERGERMRNLVRNPVQCVCVCVCVRVALRPYPLDEGMRSTLLSLRGFAVVCVLCGYIRFSMTRAKPFIVLTPH